LRPPTGYRENVAVRLRPYLSKNVLCLQCAVPESKSQTHKLKGFQLLKDMARRLNDVDISRSTPTGRGNRELNLVVLIPKTEARCGEEDISMDHLLEQRLPGERYKSAKTCLKENLFTGRRAYNLKKARIRVEVLSPNRSELLASGTSQGITDTRSKTVGALDLRDAHPLVSCERADGR